MNYYKCILEYDGTDFAGFQWQPRLKTVQSEFNRALEKILSKKITTTAASRTDSGVHAREQIVRICSLESIDPLHLKNALNQELSTQLSVRHIEPCVWNYKPATESVKKEYRYFFTNHTHVSTHDTRFVSNISAPLDFELLKESANAFLGEHDFCNFCSTGSNVKSTIREIFISNISLVNPHELFQDSTLFRFPKSLKECWQLKIEADGFLKQMIRHIISSLWMVGSGKMELERLHELLKGPRCEKQLWKVSPPNGLFLFKIHEKE